jgi:ankyrin repeat protein
MSIEKLINNNDWDKIYKKLVNNKISPNDELTNGNTIIHMASINNNKKIINYYLKNNINPLLKSNNDGNTPIHLLSIYNYTDTLKKCITEYNNFLDLLNNNNDNVTNILYNNFDFIKFACSYKTNLIINDIDNNNIITKNIDDTLKINDNNYKIIKLLISKQKQFINDYNDSFLCYALNDNKIHVSKLLIDKGYDINKKDAYFLTPLIYAIRYKQSDITKSLLDKNADINYNGPEGDDNLMMLAIDNNDEKVIDILLDKKFDVNRYDKYMDTSLNYALGNNKLSVDVITKLIYYGDLNMQNIYGVTPLHKLCKYHDLKNYSNILSKKKMDIFVKDNHNKRPLDYLNGHTINNLVKLTVKSYYTQLNDDNNHVLKNIIKCQDNIYSDGCTYELKKYMFATGRSIPIEKDKINLNKKIVAGKNITHGLFNADALHNMIYTIILLKKYDNLCIPFQYFMNDKYTNTKLLFNNLYNIGSDMMVYELVQIYNNYFFEIQPYLIIWKNKNVNYVHKDLKFLMKKCVSSNNIRFIFIKLTLIPSIHNTHANILIYDKKTNTLERFEPYGLIPYLDGSDLDDFIGRIGKECIDDKIKYVKPIDMENIVGPQVISDDSNYNIKKLGDPNGYCLAWTLWFLETRINNPDIETKELLKDMIGQIAKNNKVMGEKIFIGFIRNYAGELDKMKNEFMLEAGVRKDNLYDLSLDNKNFNKLLQKLKHEFGILMGKKIDI